MSEPQNSAGSASAPQESGREETPSQRGLFGNDELPPEEMRLLRKHVINLNAGLLSGGGLFDNTPAEVDAIFDEHLPAFIQAAGGPVRVVFYAHGGLTNEKAALATAYRHIQWWNANSEKLGPSARVYPIYFVWETGLFETLGQMFARIGQPTRDLFARDLFDFTTDPAVEVTARFLQAPRIWGSMKFSALNASRPDGGAHYVAQGLKRLLAGAGTGIELHAVGHSAGSIFHSYFVPMAFKETGREFTRGYFMAPAVRCDTFETELLPQIGAGKALRELVLFTMHKDAERADNCANVYHKSLLYLIYYALEKEPKTAILGLEDSIRGDAALRALFSLSGAGGPGRVFWSPTRETDGDSATTSISHGGFDDDAPTMGSILRRVCGLANSVKIDPLPKPPKSRALEAGVWAPPQAPPEVAALLGGGGQEFGRAAAASSSRGAGRRRALCVGINDYPTAPLSGCVADAQEWARTLQGLGFEPPRVLTDQQAFRDRILQELDTLIQTSRPGDIVVFQYSGHGTQVRDDSGDETEAVDEAICPYDFDQGHLLIDDDLGEVLARTPDGVSVTCFMDCCHSGTNTRFAVGEAPGAGMSERARHLSLSADVKSRHRDDRRSRGKLRTPGRRRTQDEMCEVVFSACQPFEVALESDGQGHFTRHATRLLRGGAAVSNEAFQRQVISAFSPDRRQNPSLDCAGRSRAALLFTLGERASSAAPPAATPAPAADGRVGSDRKALADALRKAADALDAG